MTDAVIFQSLRSPTSGSSPNDAESTMARFTISHAHTAVRRMVQDIADGYWRPTSAAFYLYEHVVELDESADMDLSELAEHLMEVFVTSICIADQYSVTLNHAYS